MSAASKSVGGLGFAPVRVGNLRDRGKLTQLGGPLSALHVVKPD
jgi:8-hydroxy-5-deazaflavin:NADPH oxidoreductase